MYLDSSELSVKPNPAINTLTFQFLREETGRPDLFRCLVLYRL